MLGHNFYFLLFVDFWFFQNPHLNISLFIVDHGAGQAVAVPPGAGAV